MRFLGLRRVYQVVFFGLFVFLVLANSVSFIGGYSVEWFLGLDPLIAVSTALAAHSLYPTLIWAVPLILLTLVLGRFFCGWICPMGAMHHFFGWVGRLRRAPDRVKLNLPHEVYTLKYYILIGMLVAATFGSVQIGLLDPIAFTWRAFATVLVPAADNVTLGALQGLRHFRFATLIALLFVAALAMNLWIPRLYCRVLCPLGALLGLLSRFALFRLQKDAARCKDCSICGADCQGAAEPQGVLRVPECMLCLNCQVGCPREGIAYKLLPSPDLTTDRLDLTRRRTLTAALGGLLAVPFLRASSASEPRPSPKRIRPPGALDEREFLERCLKCGVCMKACPTGGLQPTFAEAGLEGLWTPILVPRIGYCESQCVLCSEVCPTGAIRKLTIAEKVGVAPTREPVRIGSAFVDRGRCLPWAMDTACIVCEEVCPTSPKAVYFKVERSVARDGTERILKRPFVDLDRCTGCGICENHCPVYDEAAIRITSVGETRSAKNRIMLTGGRV